jgi:hypothetical protein
MKLNTPVGYSHVESASMTKIVPLLTALLAALDDASDKGELK